MTEGSGYSWEDYRALRRKVGASRPLSLAKAPESENQSSMNEFAVNKSRTFQLCSKEYGRVFAAEPVSTVWRKEKKVIAKWSDI